MASADKATAAAGSSSQFTEWEMGPYQRSLADNCFEESQYGSAIAMLAQLRSPKHKPSMPHIRQLIYIALQPAANATVAEKERQFLESPRKLGKQTKMSSPITSQLIVAALQLLTSFVATNSPDALGRALPRYQSADTPAATSNEDTSDSLLAKQAMCIKDAKHCWELLEEGFLLRTQVFTSPKGKSRIRRDHSLEDSSLQENSSGSYGVVGDNSWPILSWLISVFEHDEVVTQLREQLRYSPIFLAQIPPPRGTSITRWDFAAGLDVVFCCLKQSNTRRQKLGYRLVTLMINLTNTIHVDLTTLVGSIYKRLLTSGIDGFALLFSNLEPSPAVQRFKLYLSIKYLTDSTSNVEELQDNNVRPRPQARPPPKARVAGVPDATQKLAPTVTSRAQSIAAKHSLPNYTEIARALESPMEDPLPLPTTKSLIFRMKFELALCFGELRIQPGQDTQIDWENAIHDGSLPGSLKIAFGREHGDEASLYLQLLQETMGLNR